MKITRRVWVNGDELEVVFEITDELDRDPNREMLIAHMVRRNVERRSRERWGEGDLADNGDGTFRWCAPNA
jgi:hypothetical protein